jgi:hypothetical protein
MWSKARQRRWMLSTISREALYDLVWAEPVSTIAQRMGVSDVWLKKCCAKTDVPPAEGCTDYLRASRRHAMAGGYLLRCEC